MFAFLLAAEKLMNSRSVSRDEWQLFTEVSRRSELDHPEQSEVLKPSWITHKVGNFYSSHFILRSFSCCKSSHLAGDLIPRFFSFRSLLILRVFSPRGYCHRAGLLIPLTCSSRGIVLLVFPSSWFCHPSGFSIPWVIFSFGKTMS